MINGATLVLVFGNISNVHNSRLFSKKFCSRAALISYFKTTLRSFALYVEGACEHLKVGLIEYQCKLESH